MFSGAGRHGFGVQAAWARRAEGFIKEEETLREGPGLSGCPKGGQDSGLWTLEPDCQGSNDCYAAY